MDRYLAVTHGFALETIIGAGTFRGIRAMHPGKLPACHWHASLTIWLISKSKIFPRNCTTGCAATHASRNARLVKSYWMPSSGKLRDENGINDFPVVPLPSLAVQPRTCSNGNDGSATVTCREPLRDRRIGSHGIPASDRVRPKTCRRHRRRNFVSARVVGHRSIIGSKTRRIAPSTH